MRFRNTTLGKNVKIWGSPNIYDSEIGENSVIGQFVEIFGSKIGKNCAIQVAVTIPKGTIIEDDVFLGPQVVICNDKFPRSHNPNFKLEPVYISYGASIGAGSTICPGVRIGKYAMVGSGSVVTKDIPDYGLVYGNPAKIMGEVDKSGKKA